MRDIDFEADLKRYPYPRPFLEQSIWAIWVYRYGRRLMNRQSSLLRIVLFKLYWPLSRMVTTFTGISIALDAEIGPGLRIHHFGNIFIGDAVIGRNCTLRQGVTIGNRNDGSGWPMIGDDVEFGVGAVAIGPIHIGSGTKIGHLSVVVSDTPENSIVLGNPGKICPRIG